ncbi:MAG: hypothetical protein FJ091_17890 [Deltaproteobacteria bacterium]|nr:hypothetical protein [Deltaproteobacteria bacterium]
MFQRFMLLGLALLCSLLSTWTHAQGANIANVRVEVTIARTSLGPDDLDFELRVTGSGLVDGTLTPPNAAAVALTRSGADLVLTDSFANEAELSSLLPNGTYQLRVNGGALTASLVYTRPSVPSPAIAEPGVGAVVAPGSVQIVFSACAACNLVGDSVVAEIEDGQGALLDDETLTASSTTWTPQGASGPLLLPERAEFVARVTHTAIRQANVTTNDADGTLLFSHEFVQSDEVDFETGFERPQGHVCLAANYTAPPAGCTILTNAELQVLDSSGVFTAQVAGHDLEYTLAVAASGALSGNAAADLDDDGSLETSAALRGRLRGTRGDVRSRIAFALENAALSAKLKVKQVERLSIVGGTVTGTRRAKGAIGATKINEETPTNGPLPFAPLGWLLELDIDGGEPVQNALLTLEGGRSFALTGKHGFRVASGASSFKLRSAGKGIRLALSKVALDDSTAPLTMTGGALRTRVLGQSARASVP